MKDMEAKARALPGWETHLRVVQVCLLKIVKEL